MKIGQRESFPLWEQHYFYQTQKILIILFFLGDQPEIKTSVMDSIINTKTNGDEILISQYRYKHDFPILVPRMFWNKLELLTQEDSPEFENAVYQDLDLINYFYLLK